MLLNEYTRRITRQSTSCAAADPAHGTAGGLARLVFDLVRVRLNAIVEPHGDADGVAMRGPPLVFDHSLRRGIVRYRARTRIDRSAKRPNPTTRLLVRLRVSIGPTALPAVPARWRGWSALNSSKRSISPAVPVQMRARAQRAALGGQVHLGQEVPDSTAAAGGVSPMKEVATAFMRLHSAPGAQP
jgi:hypothetical protein